MDAKQLNFHNKINVIITNVKKELEKDSSSIIYAQFSSGLKGINRENASSIGVYYDFLQVCNGCRCGIIDLWDYDNLSRNEWVIEQRQNEKKSLISIGQILYEPLILDTISGDVYTFSRDDDDETPMIKIGDFEYFLINYVFGEKYQQIIPYSEDDEWTLFLKRNLIS